MRMLITYVKGDLLDAAVDRFAEVRPQREALETATLLFA